MAHPDTLLVYPNPYAVPLDAKGRAHAVYPWDPLHNPNRGWVGASIRLDDDELTAEYEQGPIILPFILVSNHYRRGVAHGDLVAADLETARRCGVSADEFRDPEAFLADARARAIAAWKAEHPDQIPAIEAGVRPEPARTAAGPDDSTAPAPKEE